MAFQLHDKQQEPMELQILKLLKPRTQLSPDKMVAYDNLDKGFLGEKKFKEILTKKLFSKCIVLYDLLLESNNTVFQIDCLILYQNEIFLLEIKNYEGDFYLNDNVWYAFPSNKEIKNPLLQLERSEFLFRQLLQKLGYKFPVKSYVIFINDEFTLYQSPMNLPIIFSSQLNRFIKKLNDTPSRLNATHTKLAKELVSNHSTHSSYERLPEYDFHQLKKGITCKGCHGFLTMVRMKKLRCGSCGYEEGIDSAVIRSAVDFSTLFPDRKIMTKAVFEWCGGCTSLYRIRMILLKYLKPVGEKRHLYFVLETE